MRFLLSLLMIAMLTAAVLTACNSSAQSNRQQAQNKNTGASNSQTAARQPEHSEESSDGIARISLEEAKKAFDSGNAIFIDTRAAVSYDAKHIKGALNIPAEEFTSRYKEVPTNKQIIAYCS